MRYTSNTKFSLRTNLIALVFISLLLIAFMSWLGLWMLKYFNIRLFQVHDIVWLMLISAFVGSVVTLFLQSWVFKPVKKLGDAMEQVAKGNFDIQLEQGKYFSEIEALYYNFNQMARELKSTEILKTDFISNVSHEFKTPINAIEGYATLLQGSQDASAEERAEYADRILLNTSRLSKLVGNILLLSKVDNQTISADNKKFRLDEQVRQAILQLEPEWTKKNVDLDVELDKVNFQGPEGLMFHIWTNLIGNAVKFSPEGGTVRICLEQQKDGVLFKVSDEGAGVAEDAAKHLFDKFYQADSSHRQEGNGLGLALVKQIVELTGGRVFFENLPQGGCCFSVKL
ncbi:MAG: HAMP domain-containing histidine kinase [Oscillospiraceae bacterium]|nr:HAMP domain-containing histidine kinase [Oscillospiraceae bacterium]